MGRGLERDRERFGLLFNASRADLMKYLADRFIYDDKLVLPPAYFA
jgi:hypothetical protein